MSRRQGYRHLLESIRTVDFKCDRILCMLDVMRGDSKDSMLEKIRESAREMYLCSLEERRRAGRLIGVSKHD